MESGTGASTFTERISTTQGLTGTKTGAVTLTATQRATPSVSFSKLYVPNMTTVVCPVLSLFTMPPVLFDTDISQSSSAGLVSIHISMIAAPNDTQWVSSPQPLIVKRAAPVQPSLTGFLATVSQRNLTCQAVSLQRMICVIPTSPSLEVESYELLDAFVSSSDILGGCVRSSSPAKEKKLLFAGRFLISATRYSRATLIGQGIMGGSALVATVGSLLSSSSGAPSLQLIAMVRSSFCSSGSSDGTARVVLYSTMPFRDLGPTYGLIGNICLVLLAGAVNVVVYLIRRVPPEDHGEEEGSPSTAASDKGESVDESVPAALALAAVAKELEVQIRTVERAAKKRKEQLLHRAKALRATRLPDFVLMAAVLMLQGTLDLACQAAHRATGTAERSVSAIGFLYALAVPVGFLLLLRNLLVPRRLPLPLGLPELHGKIILPDSFVKHPSDPRPAVRFITYRAAETMASSVLRYVTPCGFWYPKESRKRFYTVLAPLRGDGLLGGGGRGFVYCSLLYPFIVTSVVTAIVRAESTADCMIQLLAILLVFLLSALLIGMSQPHRSKAENLLAVLAMLGLGALTAAEMYGLNSEPSPALESVKLAALLLACVTGVLRVLHSVFTTFKENTDWIAVEELPIETDEHTDSRRLEREALLKVAQLMVDERKLQRKKEAEERKKRAEALKAQRLMALFETSSSSSAASDDSQPLPRAALAERKRTNNPGVTSNLSISDVVGGQLRKEPASSPLIGFDQFSPPTLPLSQGGRDAFLGALEDGRSKRGGKGNNGSDKLSDLSMKSLANRNSEGLSLTESITSGRRNSQKPVVTKGQRQLLPSLSSSSSFFSSSSSRSSSSSSSSFFSDVASSRRQPPAQDEFDFL
jgi:hypothetical protein